MQNSTMSSEEEFVAPMADDPLIDGRPLSTLKVVELRDALDRYGLNKKGNKPDLVSRLREYLANPDSVVPEEQAGSPTRRSPTKSPAKSTSPNKTVNKFLAQYLQSESERSETSEVKREDDSSPQRVVEEESPRKVAPFSESEPQPAVAPAKETPKTTPVVVPVKREATPEAEFEEEPDEPRAVKAEPLSPVKAPRAQVIPEAPSVAVKREERSKTPSPSHSPTPKRQSPIAKQPKRESPPPSVHVDEEAADLELDFEEPQADLSPVNVKRQRTETPEPQPAVVVASSKAPAAKTNSEKEAEQPAIEESPYGQRYDEMESAVKARQSLHNVRWQEDSEIPLMVDFSTEAIFHRKRDDQPERKTSTDKTGIVVHVPNDHKNSASSSAPISPKSAAESETKTAAPATEAATQPAHSSAASSEAEAGPEAGSSTERKSSVDSRAPRRPPTKSADEIFMKTKTLPALYYKPLTDEEAEQRAIERREKQRNAQASRPAYPPRGRRPSPPRRPPMGRLERERRPPSRSPERKRDRRSSPPHRWR